MDPKKSKGFLLLLIGWCFLITQHPSEAQAWETQYVGTGQFDAYTSIAVDADENAHISYYDDANQDLKYATNATGAWVPETIADAGKQGLHTSIAVDSSDKVHISYADQTSPGFALRYATKVSGSWVLEEVDTVTVTYTSIAIDLSDKVHIVYTCILCGVTNTSIELKYATNATGAWVNETILLLTTSVSGHASIAMDSLDNPHISFQDSSDKIGYATNATGAWAIDLFF